MGHKAEGAVAVGCKVLPIICDLATLGDAGCSRSEGQEKDPLARKRRIKAASRLLRWAAAVKSSKAGSIKGWKLVLYNFRNKVELKDSLDDAACARSSSSSKMSYRWVDIDDNCSTSSSSVLSRMSMPPLPAASTSRDQIMWSRSSNLLISNQAAATLRTANSDASSLGSPTKSECSRAAAQWITTDSDFVVLEL